MDCEKTGKLICTLRKQKGMTQKQLADALNLSDKAISKWERGLGYPDVSILPELSDILEINIGEILSGSVNLNEMTGGNMKKLKFYVCKSCGNIITSTQESCVSCCGKNLNSLIPLKADEEHTLNIETLEDEWFLTANHPMEKEHYISFSALVTADKFLMTKHYSQWDLQVYFPKLGHGYIYWYCTNHGLFYKLI